MWESEMFFGCFETPYESLAFESDVGVIFVTTEWYFHTFVVYYKTHFTDSMGGGGVIPESREYSMCMSVLLKNGYINHWLLVKYFLYSCETACRCCFYVRFFNKNMSNYVHMYIQMHYTDVQMYVQTHCTDMLHKILYANWKRNADQNNSLGMECNGYRSWLIACLKPLYYERKKMRKRIKSRRLFDRRKNKNKMGEWDLW